MKYTMKNMKNKTGPLSKKIQHAFNLYANNIYAHSHAFIYLRLDHVMPFFQVFPRKFRELQLAEGSNQSITSIFRSPH